MGIVLTQRIDKTDREYVAIDEDQAALLEQSGWKRQSPTKAASAKTEEK